MPGADPCWSLRKYINFTLSIAGSAFNVDKAESSPGSSQYGFHCPLCSNVDEWLHIDVCTHCQSCVRSLPSCFCGGAGCNSTRVLEMDESDMQYEVERPLPYSPQAGLFFSMQRKWILIDLSIYVGNVDYGATADELEMYFNDCGHVNRVTIPYNRFTGHPKGFANIEFSERESVRTAMTLDETLFRGRVIKVLPKRTNIPGFRTTDTNMRGGWSRGRGFRASRFYNPFRGCHFIRENGRAHPWVDSF